MKTLKTFSQFCSCGVTEGTGSVSPTCLYNNGCWGAVEGEDVIMR